MSRRRTKNKTSVNLNNLKDVLMPFTNVMLPGDPGYKGYLSGDTVYLYVGKSDGYEAGNQGCLKLSDFRKVRQFLNRIQTYSTTNIINKMEKR